MIPFRAWNEFTDEERDDQNLPLTEDTERSGYTVNNDIETLLYRS